MAAFPPAAARIRSRVAPFCFSTRAFTSASLNDFSDSPSVGNACSTADLCLFHVVAGLRYAFPKAMRQHAQAIPWVIELTENVAARPGIAAYLDSARRMAFNDNGIFRHYPELDATH